MYLWIVIVAGFFAFFAAAGIGANDAANAFATSVGSKALTLEQAVFLAAIFETAGADINGKSCYRILSVKVLRIINVLKDEADLLNVWMYVGYFMQ